MSDMIHIKNESKQNITGKTIYDTQRRIVKSATPHDNEISVGD